MPDKKPRIYGFSNGGRDGFLHACALAEDGTVLANHICSTEAFMLHDLGMVASSNWKHDKYAAHYPDGFELEFVPSEARDTHAGLQAAIAAHRAQTES